MPTAPCAVPYGSKDEETKTESSNVENEKKDGISFDNFSPHSFPISTDIKMSSLPIYTDHEGLTDEEFTSLKEKCLDARNHSYSPYSKFRVGSAILTESGEYFIGANIENAAYTACICAERSAIIQATMNGHRKYKALAVSSDAEEPVTPCGICRQVIREFNKDVPVYMFGSTGTFKKVFLKDLLPLSFGPENLGITA